MPTAGFGASPSLRTFRRASLDQAIADAPADDGAGSLCPRADLAGRRARWLGSGGNRLFDDLVGAGQQRWRDCQPKRVCRSYVDNQIELGRLLEGKISGFRSLE